MSDGILSEPEVYAMRLRHFGWRNIALALNDPKRGEEKAQSCDIAWFHESSSATDFTRLRRGTASWKIFPRYEVCDQRCARRPDGVRKRLLDRGRRRINADRRRLPRQRGSGLRGDPRAWPIGKPAQATDFHSRPP